MNIKKIILSAKTGGVAPTGVTPDFIGQLYIDTVAQKIYYAKSITLGDYSELPEFADLSAENILTQITGQTVQDILDYLLNPEMIDFVNNAPNPSHLEGRVFYDEEEHALVCYNDEADITQQLGHEHYIRVFNDSGSTIVDGKVVHLMGSDPVEHRPMIMLARADIRATANCIAVTTHDIPDQTFGYVTLIGTIHDLDTSAFASGDIIYLSTTVAGEIVNVMPKEGEITLKLGCVIRSHATEGSIYVDITDRGALTEYSLIRDVLGTTWKNGLVVSPNTPNDQSVDYTNGEYFISGTLYEITPSGNLDLTSYYTALANNEHALLKIYVDEDETLKISIGTPIGLNTQAIEPIIPVNTIAIALVEIGKDISGNPIDIDTEAVTDERQTASKQAGTSLDEFVRVGDSDTVSKHLEDALNNNGNVTFTVENEGGNESLRADAALDAEDIPTNETGITVQDKLDSLQLEIDNHEANTSNPHLVTKTQVGLGNVTNDAQLKREDGDFNTFTDKATPVDDDIALIEDSASTYTKKKLTWANIKATLKTYFDTLYAPKNQVKSQYFRLRNATTNLGDHLTSAQAQNSSFRVGFDVPVEMQTIVAVELIFVPVGTIAASQTMTLNSDYGSVGENSANHSETTATAPIAGTAGQISAASLTGVLASVAAGDIVGILISLNSIGTSINVLGIRVRYT